MNAARLSALALAVGIASLAPAPAPAQTGGASTPPGPAVPSAGPGSAQYPGSVGPGARFAERFAAANATHDGRLTLAQAQAGHMPVIARNFASIDQGGRGYVTIADIRAWRRQQRAEQGLRPGAPSVAPPRAAGPTQPGGFAP